MVNGGHATQWIATGHTIVCDGWQVLRPLQQGRYSELWLVERQGQRACLKRLREDVREAGPAPHSLQIEASLLQQLNAPWVRCLNVSPCQARDEGLLLEYLQGRALQLDDLLSEQGRYWRQLIDAVQSLHQQGWVHGDLKPENMMLTTDGELKLFDLGAAVPLGQPYPENLQFTPGWTDPTVQPGQPALAAHDWYSLATLARQLVFGVARLQWRHYRVLLSPRAFCCQSMPPVRWRQFWRLLRLPVQPTPHTLLACFCHG